MQTPRLQNLQHINSLIKRNYLKGRIDNPANIKGNKVYIFHGTKDTIVNQRSGINLKKQYAYFGANVSAEFSIASGHGQV